MSETNLSRTKQLKEKQNTGPTTTRSTWRSDGSKATVGFFRFFSVLRNPGVAESSALLEALFLLAPLRHLFIRSLWFFVSPSPPPSSPVHFCSVTKFMWENRDWNGKTTTKNVVALLPLHWCHRGHFFHRLFIYSVPSTQLRFQQISCNVNLPGASTWTPSSDLYQLSIFNSRRNAAILVPPHHSHHINTQTVFILCFHFFPHD